MNSPDCNPGEWGEWVEVSVRVINASLLTPKSCAGAALDGGGRLRLPLEIEGRGAVSDEGVVIATPALSTPTKGQS